MNQTELQVIEDEIINFMENHSEEQLATIDKFIAQDDEDDEDYNVNVSMTCTQRDDDYNEDKVVYGDPKPPSEDMRNLIYPTIDFSNDEWMLSPLPPLHNKSISETLDTNYMPKMEFIIKSEVSHLCDPHHNVSSTPETDTPPTVATFPHGLSPTDIDPYIITGAKLLLHLKNAQVHNANVFLRGTNYKQANNLTVDDVYKVNIMDAGANTLVIGQGWELIACTNRKVNVIGFDQQIAIKKNLPITSAVTTTDVEDKTHLLQIHEAVHNASSPHSLPFVFQLQERIHGMDVV